MKKIVSEKTTKTFRQKHEQAIDLIDEAYTKYFPSITILNSFSSKEGAVLLDIVQRLNLPLNVTFIDTGRLPESVLEHMAHMQLVHPRMDVTILYPDANRLSEFTSRQGINCFRESVEERKLCCGIRKVDP